MSDFNCEVCGVEMTKQEFKIRDFSALRQQAITCKDRGITPLVEPENIIALLDEIEKLKQGLRDIKTNLKEMWIELHPKSKDEKCKYFLIVDKVITQINQVLGGES